MANVIDLTGKRYGMLTVLRLVGRKRAQAAWECACDCGKTVVMCAYDIKSPVTIGRKKSCGCQRGIRHGRHGTPEYRSWANMLTRCLNARSKDFQFYGGRGISVCTRWLSFPEFLADVGEMPGLGYTIGRIDNRRGYEPGNVRWETRKTQGNNKRNNHLLTAFGITRTLSEWSGLIGLNESVIRGRIRRGWSPEDSVGTKKVNRWSRRK